jgi:hypothetical protein
MHANWQGYVEVIAANHFVASNVHSIALSKVHETHWNAIKCQEHLGNCPEADIRQATINLNSRVWKSLEDSLPKLYCIDLAKAYVKQESFSLRICVRRKGMIFVCPMNVPMRNLQQKAEQGKKTSTNSNTRFLQESCSMNMHDVCQKYGGTCTM